MSTKYPKLILLVCLLLVILGCKAVKEALTPDPNRFPVKDLEITMDIDQREELFTQLQSFASQHSLELRSTFYDADKKEFLMVLAGNGFNISVISTNSLREIQVLFYNETSTPVSQEMVNKLWIDLKTSLNKIPNILIKEKVKRLHIMMGKDQSKEIFTKFIAQLKTFADQHALEYIESSYDPDLAIFRVEMNGEGFQITSEAVLSPLREFNVDFYIHYDGNGDPTPTSQETLDELFSDLKNHFSEIPNVTITEQP